MMVNGPAYWARVADYLLMYDQIVIPTANLQILSVLRFMLGDDVLLELLETRTIVFTRFDQWFGYIGTAGVIFFKVGDGPETKSTIPNLATSHFLPLEEAIDAAFIAMNPPSTFEIRQRFKTLLIDYTARLATETLLEGVRAEAYRDIQGSPYLQAFFSLRNTGRSIENLVGSKPDMSRFSTLTSLPRRMTHLRFVQCCAWSSRISYLASAATLRRVNSQVMPQHCLSCKQRGRGLVFHLMVVPPSLKFSKCLECLTLERRSLTNS